MGILNFLFAAKPVSTASTAKERLQLIIAHEGSRRAPGFLPKLKLELLQVVAKYMKVSEDSCKLDLQHRDGADILEINLILEELPA